MFLCDRDNEKDLLLAVGRKVSGSSSTKFCRTIFFIIIF